MYKRQVRDIDIDFTGLQEKAGVFGEPIFIGTVLGAVLGIVAQPVSYTHLDVYKRQAILWASWARCSFV